MYIYIYISICTHICKLHPYFSEIWQPNREITSQQIRPQDLAQQLQAASEQSRQGLEAERRKCSSRLEQAPRFGLWGAEGCERCGKSGGFEDVFTMIF